jgi:hypothetical protein
VPTVGNTPCWQVRWRWRFDLLLRRHRAYLALAGILSPPAPFEFVIKTRFSTAFLGETFTLIAAVNMQSRLSMSALPLSEGANGG